jgi:NTE family protein
MLFNQKSVGLVLGGGGVRGFFHVGVIKAIQELGITINQISGTSIGAVIGAIYAANPDVDFDKLVAEIDYLKLIKTMAFGTKESSSIGIEPLLRSYLPVTNFSELKIPFSFNATDINLRQEVVFNRGSLFPGLLAAITVPGVLSPVKIANQYLVDGGVLNNLPISLVKNTRRLIVSDITGPIKTINTASLAVDVLYSSVALMQHYSSQIVLKKITSQKVTYLNLNDDKIFILDFRKKNYQALIDLGYKAMMESHFS